MKTYKCVSLIVLIVLLLSACAEPYTPIEPDSTQVAPVVCSHPESDNSSSWELNACVEISTQVYSVVVIIYDDIASHTEVNAEGSSSGGAYGGYGSYSSSFRMWQDGKGILPVQLISVSPDFHELEPGDLFLLKTSDLKAMSIPVGATARFVCNEDVEVLSPNQNNQWLTKDRLTYELDDCRMETPRFVIQVTPTP